MQMKNKIKVIGYIFLLISFISNLNADEFNIVANEIIVDKENEIITGIGSVQASDTEGKIVKAEKIIYEKEKEFLLAQGEVLIADTDGNILKTDKATYDKINEVITTYENTTLILKEGYILQTKNILYDVKDKILSSKNLSKFEDDDGNIIETNMFQYQINDNLFSSIGKIKIIDIKRNKYFFKEIHIDTKNKEMFFSYRGQPNQNYSVFYNVKQTFHTKKFYTCFQVIVPGNLSTVNNSHYLLLLLYNFIIYAFCMHFHIAKSFCDARLYMCLLI